MIYQYHDIALALHIHPLETKSERLCQLGIEVTKDASPFDIPYTQVILGVK